MGSAKLVNQTADPLVVKVQDLVKKYRRVPAVNGVDFEVHRGELFGLIGPDGAGKSSVLKALAGVQTYDGGRIEVFGQHIHSERTAERVKGRLGLMPQGLGNNLYADLSVEENIDYFAGLRLVPRDALLARKQRLLDLTRLAPFRDRLIKQLSGGMKQKLGLVCTLIHEPELVLLDEPTTGVDPVSRRDFWSILTELVHELNMTAVVTTAYMDEAAYLNRLALMLDGRIVSQGTEDDIMALAPGTVVSMACRNQIETLDRLSARFPLAEGLGQQVRLFVPEPDARQAVRQVADQLAGASSETWSCSAPDLEDVLAHLLVTRHRPSGFASSRDAVPPGGAAGLGRGPNQSGPIVGGIAARGSASAENTGSVAIRADRLVRKFGSFVAVDRVSFEVRQGQIFGLLGSNGAGKTTVIKMLTGLLPPTGGEGMVAGADAALAGQQIKERIGYMSQAFSLYLDMTVGENIEFYAGVYGLFPRQTRQRLPWVLGFTGLEEYRQRMTSDLPMGLRQRLALGCALVHEPSVVFLDEPTSGVDVLGRRQFWEILLRLAREAGMAILVTTHYMSEAEHCDTLALMYAGRIVAEGTPGQLRSDLEAESGFPLAVWTNQPLAALRVVRREGFPRAALFGRGLRVLSPDPAADFQRISRLLREAGIQVLDHQRQESTMEDVFVQCILSQEEQNESA